MTKSFYSMERCETNPMVSIAAEEGGDRIQLSPEDRSSWRPLKEILRMTQAARDINELAVSAKTIGAGGIAVLRVNQTKAVWGPLPNQVSKYLMEDGIRLVMLNDPPQIHTPKVPDLLTQFVSSSLYLQNPYLNLLGRMVSYMVVARLIGLPSDVCQMYADPERFDMDYQSLDWTPAKTPGQLLMLSRQLARFSPTRQHLPQLIYLQNQMMSELPPDISVHRVIERLERDAEFVNRVALAASRC